MLVVREFSVRLYLLLIGVVLLAALICVSRGHTSQEPLPSPAPSRAAKPSKFEFQGAGSCASMACHNADALTGFRSREYKIALERDFSTEIAHVKDKHAQAYAVLFNDRSQRMIRNLQGLSADKVVHPEHEDLCLRCHVHPEYARQPMWMRADGVSCETCHGPAERWLATHFRPGWNDEARKASGMRDTRSPAGRVRICVDCHIGGKDAEVNHDLIAAGHPRMNFEFSAFQYELHKHWDYRKDKDPACDPRGRMDFEARSWALGQVASAEAALRLLAERAGDQRRPWTEFAEYNCYACHHDLQPKSWRQENYAKGQAGKLTWNPWYYALLDEAVEALGPGDPNLVVQLRLISAEMESPRPNRDKTAKLARQAAALLEALLQREQSQTAQLPVGALLKKALDSADLKSALSWDHAMPRYAALAALARASQDLGRPSPKLREFADSLRFPLGFDSPRDYDPAKIEQAIRNLKQHLPR